MSQAAVKVRAGQIRYIKLRLAPDSQKIAKICLKLVFSRCFSGIFRVLELTKLELKSSKGFKKCKSAKVLELDHQCDVCISKFLVKNSPTGNFLLATTYVFLQLIPVATSTPTSRSDP